MTNLAPATDKIEKRFTDDEHRQHCRIAGCHHVAVYAAGAQGWCDRCRKVAFKPAIPADQYIAFCMICGKSCHADEPHTCPPHVLAQFNITIWARQVQCLGKAQARKSIREKLPTATTKQIAEIIDGEIELIDLGRLFGHEWITDGAE